MIGLLHIVSFSAFDDEEGAFPVKIIFFDVLGKKRLALRKRQLTALVFEVSVALHDEDMFVGCGKALESAAALDERSVAQCAYGAALYRSRSGEIVKARGEREVFRQFTQFHVFHYISTA